MRHSAFEQSIEPHQAQALSRARQEEDPRGEGLRYAVGELLACPFCLAPWVAASLVGGTALWPQEGRFVAHLFTTVAVSDFLQKGYAWLSSQTAESREVAEFFDKASAAQSEPSAGSE